MIKNGKPEKNNGQKAPEGTIPERNSRHRSANYQGSAAKDEEDTHKQESEKKSDKNER
jgi:hypothetical protein